MQTKTISTMQPLTGQTAGAAISLVIANNNSIPIIQRIDGYMNGTASTQYWLHFFAGTTAPANSTKPLFELQVVGGNGFSWDFGNDGGLDFNKMADLPIGTTNLIVCVSTTSTTFTTATTQTMDCEVTLNEPFIPVLGLTSVGDTTTAVNGRVIFTNNQTVRKAIYSANATNNDATTQYLMLFPNGIPISNQIPLAAWTFTAGQSRLLYFGSDGFAPYAKDSSNNTQNGCALYASSDPTKYVAPSGNHWTIQATFK